MEHERARELLERERARIEQAIADLEGEGTGEEEELSHADQHPADAATDLQEREQDAGVVVRLKADLAAIERAEARVRDGTYGTSVDSGEPIPDARLEALPWAERTVEEQERFEAAGRAGPRGSVRGGGHAPGVMPDRARASGPGALLASIRAVTPLSSRAAAGSGGPNRRGESPACSAALWGASPSAPQADQRE